MGRLTIIPVRNNIAGNAICVVTWYAITRCRSSCSRHANPCDSCIDRAAMAIVMHRSYFHDGPDPAIHGFHHSRDTLNMLPMVLLVESLCRQIVHVAMIASFTVYRLRNHNVLIGNLSNRWCVYCVIMIDRLQ